MEVQSVSDLVGILIVVLAPGKVLVPTDATTSVLWVINVDTLDGFWLRHVMDVLLLHARVSIG